MASSSFTICKLTQFYVTSRHLESKRCPIGVGHDNNRFFAALRMTGKTFRMTITGAPSVPKNGTLVAKSAQNAPSVLKNGTLVAPGRGYYPKTRQKRNQGRA